MSLSGGPDRSDLAPFVPGRETRVLGTHKGAAAALNVENPQPGMHYSWIRNTPDEKRRRSMLGYQPIGPDDPESKGAEMDPNWGTSLDGSVVRRDVVLARIPLERLRLIREENLRAARAALRTSTDDFLAKGEPYDRRYGAGGERRVYYVRGDHRTRFGSQE
jgi:hypothetical protein